MGLPHFTTSGQCVDWYWFIALIVSLLLSVWFRQWKTRAGYETHRNCHWGTLVGSRCHHNWCYTFVISFGRFSESAWLPTQWMRMESVLTTWRAWSSYWIRNSRFNLLFDTVFDVMWMLIWISIINNPQEEFICLKWRELFLPLLLLHSAVLSCWWMEYFILIHYWTHHLPALTSDASIRQHMLPQHKWSKKKQLNLLIMLVADMVVQCISAPMCIGQTDQDLKNGMSIINVVTSRFGLVVKKWSRSWPFRAGVIFQPAEWCIWCFGWRAKFQVTGFTETPSWMWEPTSVLARCTWLRWAFPSSPSSLFWNM